MNAADRTIDSDAASLRSELIHRFRDPLAPIDDAAFDDLARRAFAYQFAANAPYRAFCERRGRTPDSIASWTAIPAVPTAAFKELPLASGDPATAQAIFRTSGTTAGAERRGVRYMIDLALYHAAAVPFFAVAVLPDDAELPFLSLMPSARALPDSSLAHMIGLVSDRFGAQGSRSYADAAGRLDTVALMKRLADAESDGTALCLLGTSLAFVHLLEVMERARLRVQLPVGSRLMDTGGYKGTTRSFEPAQLRAWIADVLGIEAPFAVNEYGMTELCSQFYDDALLRRMLPDARREVGADEGLRSGEVRKFGPPWVRSRVVDPVSLEPVEHGNVGILQHFDLANLDAVIAVQTEDLAREVPGGFVLLGREPDAPPRGCSIAMDELLRAAQAG